LATGDSTLNNVRKLATLARAFHPVPDDGVSMSEALQVRRFTGPQVAAHIPELARLRSIVFRQFPDLCDGHTDCEERYLGTHTQSAASVLVLAFDGECIVGTSTGLPLADVTDNIERVRSRGRVFNHRDRARHGETCALPLTRVTP
jgi:hypothetical protein